MQKTTAVLLLTGILACGDDPFTAPGHNPSLASGPINPNLVAVDLGPGGGKDIDEFGRIVGWTKFGKGPTALRVSVLWSPDVRRGTTGSLVTLNGGIEALALNEATDIIGYGAGSASLLWQGGSVNPFFLSGGTGADISDPLSNGDHFAVEQGPGGDGHVYWLHGTNFNPVPDVLPGGQPEAVNKFGTVVGRSIIGPGMWTHSGVPGTWTRTDLALPAGTAGGSALDINADPNGEVIVGHVLALGSGCSAGYGVAWSVLTMQPVLLPDLAGGTCSVAWAVNDAGIIAGIARNAFGRDVPVLWLPGSGGSYTVHSIYPVSLGRRMPYATASGLNEPESDATGATWLEVVGFTIGSMKLWKVRLP